MRFSEARVVATVAVIVIAVTGTIIYSKSGEQTVRPSAVDLSVTDAQVVVNDQSAIIEPSEEAVIPSKLPEPSREITVIPVGVAGKEAKNTAAVPPTKVDDSDSLEIEERSALIERLSVEIDSFLKLRQEARDENPLPELVEWLKLKDEIEDVAVTESSGELVITFTGGGATVLQIGQ